MWKELSTNQLYVAMSKIQGNFISTWLVLDVEKPQCLSCMWCVLVVCNNVQNTRKVLGLFQMWKDHSVSVVCSHEGQETSLGQLPSPHRKC